ncbi:Predicted nuclease (RNAse H fold) [Methanolobus vulcani]|uniref:Predicted nuclease (RNAse H fold) n=1 Tax=Methanolobus vulcani TaxID=38026 RepID=A0A7Z7AXR1_9EURY|nr:DUF429 domain-containing protein [Methanolobus vulcani]SDF93684.1 Predicted nuclease (RNAse H fold) [Methanolobus vulcani]
MYFIGVDLAWSYNTKEGSGIAIIKGDSEKATLYNKSTVFSNGDVLEFINNNVHEDNALIAIDIPLVVPNEEGMRNAEKELNSTFWKYDANARPASITNILNMYGSVRGNDLSKCLENHNFKHDFCIQHYEDTRKFFEVYPHPATVVLFNLDKILDYKKRERERRIEGFKKYKKHLQMLSKAKPALDLPVDLLSVDVEKLTKSKLKQYEDILDAVFCAYVAYLLLGTPREV